MDLIRKLRKKAERGDTESQLELGILLSNQETEYFSPDEAIMYLESAAEQGSGKAMALLSDSFNEWAPATNREAACFWYDMAVKTGYVPEHAFWSGSQTTDELRKGFFYKKLAADHGDEAAVYDVAYAYEHGIGVSADEKEALRFYRMAAQKGNGTAIIRIYQLMKKNPVLSEGVSAVKYLEQHAAPGNAEIYLELAGAYESGCGVPYDLKRAVDYYEAAAGAGNDSALNWLANYYSAYDKEKSINYYSILAKKGYAKAQYELGKALENEKTDEALGWYKKAAGQGNADAMFDYARLLCITNGDNIDEVLEEAVDCLSMAKVAGKEEAGRAATGLVVQELESLHSSDADELAIAKMWKYLRDGVNIPEKDCLKFLALVCNRIFETAEDLFMAFEGGIGEELVKINKCYPINLLYDVAEDFESKGKIYPAIGTYFISAQAGNRKAAGKLINMSGRSSRYFMELVDAG